jgi:hypothetical protein
MKNFKIGEIYSITSGDFKSKFILITKKVTKNKITGKLWNPKNPKDMKEITLKFTNVGDCFGKILGLIKKK